MNADQTLLRYDLASQENKDAGDFVERAIE
jgi:hypothetical protein